MAGLWYRAGTVSVTNGIKKVTGFGSLWETTTYKPDKGHTFWGPDGKAYEIDYVESDTALYLVTVYTGVTAASQAYSIDITRTSTIPAFSRELSAQLAYAQAQYDSWQQVLTGSGTVTLTAPDGQQIQVPALSAFQPTSASLKALQALTPVKDKIPVFNSSTGAELITLTPFAKGLIDDATAREMRETLGVSAYALRNLVVNGDFNVAQLGTSVVEQANGAFITDMWRLYWAGAGLRTSRGVSSAATPGPFGLRSWLEIQGASGNIGAEIETRVESRDSARLCLLPCVASAYIYNNTGADRLFFLYVSTPDAYEDWSTTSIKLVASLFVPNGQWGRISGKFTADSSFANGASVRVNSGGGIAAGRSVLVSGVQLEAGTVLTEFEACPIGLSLLLCQRYYESTTYRLDVTGNNVSNSSSLFIRFVTKRTTPTLTRVNESVTACVFNSFQQASNNGGSIVYSPTTSGGGVAFATLIADARL